MAEVKKYTAEDIEKYHKGQLSMSERNALEKAALDDPFLADAIEGFASMSSVDHSVNLDDLREKISQRINKAGRKRAALISMPWLRVAAMIIFIAGAGLLVYQFAFNKSNKSEIAKLDEKSGGSTVATDSSTATKNQITPPEKNETVAAGKQITEDSEKRFTNTSMNKGTAAFETKTGSDLVTTQQPPVTNDDVKSEPKITFSVAEKKVQKEDVPDKQEESRKDAEKNIGENRYYDKVGNVSGITKRAGPSRQLQENNFRGRVLDPNNRPVPFANITNTKDKEATYSDANGYFNLASKDTVLDVQVSSLGYKTNNTRLRDLNENQVILKDEKNVLSEVVVSAPKANTARRSVFTKKKTDEPEPVDGWENYDLYLVNNLKIPGELKTINTPGQVEVSFEINKSGKPVNLKIEKSFCTSCDAEAIRLIKEGPSWKRSSKKDRAFVTVPFTNNQ